MLRAQLFSTASAKTACRNVMTLRTVLGASPRSNIARARRSTSSGVTASTRRLPSDRGHVHALHRLAVLPVREATALDNKPLPQHIGGFIDSPRSSLWLSTTLVRLH